MTEEELRHLNEEVEALFKDKQGLLEENRRLRAELETYEIAQTAYEESIKEVRAEEREACAKVAEELEGQFVAEPSPTEIADAIRARGKPEGTT